MFRFSSSLLMATVFCGSAALAQTPAYVQSRSVAVGSPERWDYLTLDKDSNRVFLSHGDRVDVLDARSGALVGSVRGIAGGTHGIGISGGKGYTDDGKAGEVVVFDLKTFKILSHIKAREDADGITVDPKTGHVFVVDGDSAVVTVIDPGSDKVVATVAGGGGLEFAVADGRGKIYVNGAEKREIVRIDTATNTADAHWPVPQCDSPHGLAIDRQAHRLFMSCVNKQMTIVDADTGRVVTSLPIGAGTDGAAFDPVRKLAFSSNGADGTISVIHEISPDRFVSAGNIKTAITARTMTLDPETGRLYVAAAAVDLHAPVPSAANGRPGRPKPLPGSLKVLFMDPK